MAWSKNSAPKLTAQWGTTVADLSGNENRVVYAPQTDNLGGAGGFSAGVKKAYELGAEWFWVMDDDVAVMPEGIERLAKWTDRHDVIQGSRYDYDGGPFYWPVRFASSRSAFRTRSHRLRSARLAIA